MFFAIPNEEGRIVQANKVYDPTGYEDLLREHGHAFVTANVPGVLPPEDWFVMTKELRERPTMPVEVNKTVIKCGDADAAVFTNCFRGSTLNVTTGGTTVYNIKMDSTNVEISIPVPCVYQVTFDLWPFRTFTARIEAVA